MSVIITGGSFRGLTAAYELRKYLDRGKCEITILSREPRFVFIPSLPWVVMGSRSLDQIWFGLAGPLARRGISFVHTTIEGIDPTSAVFRG